MDCEGCEFKSLPALDKPEISKRVRRLAGELHLPDKKLEDLTDFAHAFIFTNSWELPTIGPWSQEHISQLHWNNLAGVLAPWEMILICFVLQKHFCGLFGS